VDPKDKSGEFKRQQSVFRNWIEDREGADFPPEKGRYHLYVSYACPWGEFAGLSFFENKKGRGVEIMADEDAC